jgi:hypothetical protein
MRNKHILKLLQEKEGLVIAEIGVHEATHAQSILKALPNMKKMYLIDPYCDTAYIDAKQKLYTGKGRKATASKKLALDRLRKYEDKVQWIFETSDVACKQIATEELDYLYIDGNHQYEYVKADIETYLEKVKKGGILAGHDFMGDHNGVEQAVREIFGSNFYQWDQDKVEWWIVRE